MSQQRNNNPFRSPVRNQDTSSPTAAPETIHDAPSSFSAGHSRENLNNPFADPVPRSSTSASPVPQASPSTSTPPRIVYSPPPGPPPQASSQSTRVPASLSPPRVTVENTDDDLDDLDDLPPAYTPTPDLHQGEYTVERGPRRPFQTTPATGVPPRHPSGASSLLSRPGIPLSTRPTDPIDTRPRSNSNSNWSAYPGAHRSTASLGSTTNNNNNVLVIPPPPLPPRRPSSASANTSPNGARSISDFARDFYAAGGANADALLTDNGNGLAGGANTNRYAPPPGPPPPPNPAGGGGRQNNNNNNNNGVPDDGRPTSTPMPGHPLLKNGRLLVYTGGYECRKCHNTGYKAYDPNHPCRRCWENFSKPYTGALAYAPGASPSSFSPSSSATQHPRGTTFQKPLPRFGALQRQRSISLYDRPYASSSSTPSFSPPSGPPPIPSRPSFESYGSGGSGGGSRMDIRTGPPPRGVAATRMRPGDPRLGGALCWGCDGDGVNTFLFLSETCRMCKGVGRVYRD